MAGTADTTAATNRAADAATWRLETPLLALRWERGPSGDVQLTSMRTPDQEWLAAPTSIFSRQGDRLSPIAFRDVTATEDANRLRMRGRLDPPGLTASITWTAYRAASVVMAEIEVVNESDAPLELGSLSSLRLSTARDGGSRLGVLAGGRWDEGLPPRGYRLRTFDCDEIGRGTSFGAAADGRSSGEHLPWFALIGGDGGLLSALVWSGRWRLDVDRRGETNLVSFGISDFSAGLAPGERLALPSVVVAGYAGDLDDGANAWRRWVAEHWMPPVPENWPWIQYNHWYAYYGDIDAARLFEEARLAADLGCEVFVIDDGWFRGRRPDSYYAGWGDWVEDRAKFPVGLRAFGDRVRDLGLKFGLWVEPERADDGGELVRRHPDWGATRQGQAITRPGPAGAEGVHLCLGNPRVRRWMTDEMTRVVREYGVDWLKWDYNLGYGLGCDAADHGHQPTAGHYAHTLGLYGVLGDLRAACPDLVIENCASGGHRVDLGTLHHTHTNWVSDYTHRAASCRQHARGAGLFLPLPHVNTWVLEDRDATEFRSRMGGAFGVSAFLGKWSDGERASFRRAVAEYRSLRPYLTGDRFLLTGPWHQDWDITQLVHPSGEEFVLLAFRQRGRVREVRVHPRLRAVEPVYVVRRSEAGTVEEIPGVELASRGLGISLPNEGGSEIITVAPVR